MKKRTIIILVILGAIVAFFLYGALVVSKRSPVETTKFSNAGVDYQVVYCRPFKKGRMIFGEEKDGALQPYGKYWRLGANAATEITFNKDVTFGDKSVKTGTYRMYTIPGATEWTVALNSELGVYFGIVEPDYAKDVVRIQVPVGTAPSETEQLIINFSGEGNTTNMDFVWDKTLIRVPIIAQ